VRPDYSPLITVRHATKKTAATHSVTTFALVFNEIRGVTAFTPDFHTPLKGNPKPTWILLFWESMARSGTKTAAGTKAQTAFPLALNEMSGVPAFTPRFSYPA